MSALIPGIGALNEPTLKGRCRQQCKIDPETSVPPAELEGSIIRSGKVKEAAAVGIPDENKGSKIIIAIVALNKNDPEIKEEYFMDLIIKDLGKSFKPDKIIFVSDLPKTRNMKIMRRVIKTCLTNQDPGDISTLLNPESVEEIKTHAI